MKEFFKKHKLVIIFFILILLFVGINIFVLQGIVDYYFEKDNGFIKNKEENIQIKADKKNDNTIETNSLDDIVEKNNLEMNDVQEDELVGNEHKKINLDNIFYEKEGFIYQVDFKLEHVDAETFEILNYCFAKDKNNIYLFSHAHYGFYAMDEYDIETFKSTGDFYAKDKNGIYFCDYGEMENVDVETFEPLNTYFSKDKNNFYYYNKRIENVDFKNFKVLDNHFAVNSKHAYYIDFEHEPLAYILKNANPINFKTLKGDFAKDDDNVYFTYSKVKNADPSTFEVLQDGFTKDKNNVYYSEYFSYNNNHTEKIEGADSNTFDVIGHYYSKDKNNCYFFVDKVDMSECEKASNN